MPSSTSGLTSFSLDVDDIIEAALEPLGGEHQSGIDTAKARRTLNLVLIQLQNKNIPLNKLDTLDLPLVQGTATYTLDASVNDVLNCTLSVPNSSPTTFIPLDRYGMQRYNTIPNKTVQNRPNTFMTQRLNNAVTITFWPVPNLGTYTAKMVVAKRIEDITASYQKVDLNSRFYPLLIKWLTYELALTRQGIPEDLRSRLKTDLMDAMPDTFESDDEKVDFTVKPGGINGR